MKLVAVTRVLNEDDIVEAFIRHHQPQVDHHLLLDNGSTDRTLEILACLRQEGARLTVLQNTAPHYVEGAYNTHLYSHAAREMQADWVVFLDSDEFIDARRQQGGMRALLAAVPPEIGCVKIHTADYFDARQDVVDDLLVPRRIRSRERVQLHPVPRVSVRGDLVNSGVRIEGGNHEATIGEQPVPAVIAETMSVAHFSRRSAWQTMTKSVVGRLKVLAAGRAEVESQRSYHYTGMFEDVRDAPERLMRNPGFLYPSYGDLDLTDDPIEYLGGELRYTRAEDPVMRAVRTVTAYAELLAVQHGRLIDTNEGVRLQTQHWAGTWSFLF